MLKLTLSDSYRDNIRSGVPVPVGDSESEKVCPLGQSCRVCHTLIAGREFHFTWPTVIIYIKNKVVLFPTK